jgi:hypothetical protein
VDAVRLLSDDHSRLRALFAAHERARGKAERRDIAALTGTELALHVALEEEIFYPALARARAEAQSEAPGAAGASAPGGNSQYAASRERTHASVAQLARRVQDALAAGAPHERAYVRLRAAVLAHCEEEEASFPEARRCLGERLERVGWLLAGRRAELETERYRPLGALPIPPVTGP